MYPPTDPPETQQFDYQPPGLIRMTLKAAVLLLILGLTASWMPWVSMLLTAAVLLHYAHYVWQTLTDIEPRHVAALVVVAALCLLVGVAAKLGVGPLIIVGVFLTAVLPLWWKAYGPSDERSPDGSSGRSAGEHPTGP
jgi:hypothetical protein